MRYLLAFSLVLLNYSQIVLATDTLPSYPKKVYLICYYKDTVQKIRWDWARVSTDLYAEFKARLDYDSNLGEYYYTTEQIDQANAVKICEHSVAHYSLQALEPIEITQVTFGTSTFRPDYQFRTMTTGNTGQSKEVMEVLFPKSNINQLSDAQLSVGSAEIDDSIDFLMTYFDSRIQALKGQKLKWKQLSESGSLYEKTLFLQTWVDYDLSKVFESVDDLAWKSTNELLLKMGLGWFNAWIDSKTIGVEIINGKLNELKSEKNPSVKWDKFSAYLRAQIFELIQLESDIKHFRESSNRWLKGKKNNRAERASRLSFMEGERVLKFVHAKIYLKFQKRSDLVSRIEKQFPEFKEVSFENLEDSTASASPDMLVAPVSDVNKREAEVLEAVLEEEVKDQAFDLASESETATQKMVEIETTSSSHEMEPINEEDKSGMEEPLARASDLPVTEVPEMSNVTTERELKRPGKNIKALREQRRNEGRTAPIPQDGSAKKNKYRLSTKDKAIFSRLANTSYPQDVAVTDFQNLFGHLILSNADFFDEGRIENANGTEMTFAFKRKNSGWMSYTLHRPHGHGQVGKIPKEMRKEYFKLFQDLIGISYADIE